MLGNKLRELRARRAAGETGFTLVELLVVVVIIVALAAIAVPIFLNQANKAEESAAKSDLASVAKFISTGIATGGLEADEETPATGGLVTAEGPKNLTASDANGTTGTFGIPAGMTVYFNVGTGAFCAENGQGEGETPLAVANNSGGVAAGSCSTAGAFVAPVAN